MSILSRNRRGGCKERLFDEDWDPLHEFQRADVITTITGPTHTSMTSKSSAANAHIDWKETSDAHVFKLDLPGVKKNEVRVEVDDDRVLCICVEKRVEKEEHTDMWRRVERSSGKSIQRISLPNDANAERVKADMNNGVLTVTVPKHHVKKTSARLIEVSGH